MKTNPKILIVDDVPANATLLADILRNDYTIIIATNGHDALKIAGLKNPDLILLDINMPDIDGYEVCKRLKSELNTKDIPIIFVTTRDEENSEFIGLELGAIDYITKPFRKSIIKTRIKNHMMLQQKGLYIRYILDHSMEMIISLDNNYNIQEFNATAEIVCGYTKTQIHGKPFKKLFADPVASFNTVISALTEYGVYSGEVELLRKNGDIFPVEMRLAMLPALVGHESDFGGVVAGLRDLTDDNALEKQRSLMSQLLRENRDLENVKSAAITLRNVVLTNLQNMQLLRYQAQKSSVVSKQALEMFDQSVDDMTSFFEKMAHMTSMTKKDVLAGVELVDVDGRFAKYEVPRPNN